MRETVWHFVIMLLITGAVFFTNLGESRLWDRDEPRNAGCAAEMMARGDWVVPTFNDELRHNKPVLLYWLIMSAYSVFGVNEFSARFWSAALATGTTMVTYGIARRLVNPRIGLLAAIAVASCVMFDVAARAATPDSALMFCGTSALLIYVLGTFKHAPQGVELKHSGCWFPKNLTVVVCLYGMLGLGVLAKGPVGFLLPMAMIGMFILIQSLPETKHESPQHESIFSSLVARLVSWMRPFHPVHFLRTLRSMRVIVAAAVILLVAAPWYLMVDSRTGGDFTQLFFVSEHFGRATTAMENHGGGIWFYPLAILFGFFPWSIIWGPIAIGLFTMRKGSDHRIATTFMLCWIGVQVGAFSLAATKLPSYVTPCLPALAILTAICLTDFVEARSNVGRGWFYAAFAGLVISGVGITGGLGFAATKYFPGQIWIAGLGVIPLIGGCLLLWMLNQNQTRRLPTAFALMAVLFCWSLFGFGTVAIDSRQQSHLVLDKLKTDGLVATYGCMESSWVFYGGRPIHELDLEAVSDGSSESASGSTLDRVSFWHPKPRVSVETLLGIDPDAMLITTGEHVEALKKRLPDDFEVLQRAGYFLRDKQLFLLGKRQDSIAILPGGIELKR